MSNPALTTQELQKKLQEAQEGRKEVFLMRPKTEENAKGAHRLLRENHLAERIRRSFSS